MWTPGEAPGPQGQDVDLLVDRLQLVLRWQRGLRSEGHNIILAMYYNIL